MESLSPEQKQVLELVENEQNVFFTGPAGTGKSFLLRLIIRMLRKKYHPQEVAVTASTGIAGLNIGGRTIHSFAGIGQGNGTAKELVIRIKKLLKASERWRKTRALIIDEISMLDGKLFDKLEAIARALRNSAKSFGGIQLVLCGDFFQLPPVPGEGFGWKEVVTFAFHARTWNECTGRPIFLRKVFRQRDDDFVRILSNMRHGVVMPADIQCLKALSRPLRYDDGIEPSELFPRRSEVRNCNRIRLEALSKPEHTYHAMDSAGYDIKGLPITKPVAEKLLDRINAPKTIPLRIGAQVMLLKNMNETLVNGSIGKVIAFMTLSQAQMDSTIKIPEKLPGGQKSEGENISFSGFRNDELRPLTGHIFGRNEVWPVVDFRNDDKLLCIPQDFSIMGPRWNYEACRIQVPLMLAWALSIHKCQGQTLNRVKVDLANIFETGQAYVAISRATTIEGLELHNFDVSKVAAHQQVTNWHQFWETFGDGDWPPELDDVFVD